MSTKQISFGTVQIVFLIVVTISPHLQFPSVLTLTHNTGGQMRLLSAHLTSPPPPMNLLRDRPGSKRQVSKSKLAAAGFAAMGKMVEGGARRRWRRPAVESWAWWGPKLGRVGSVNHAGSEGR
jgi:hypothetical protein